MISSILAARKNREELRGGLIISICCSGFCLVFYLVYNIFSHGVHSPFMTFLFAWPLALEVIPTGLCLMVRSLPGPSVLSSLSWNTGTALVTAGSLLRGIFDIAGNSSDHQFYMMVVGFTFLAAGLVLYFLGASHHFSRLN